MKTGSKVNLGCGAVFVTGAEWVNLDVTPSSPAVERANLLGRLPIKSGSARLVYASHFVEHIPRVLVAGFLQECLRALEPDGVVRLVLPDLEEMATSYLAFRAEGAHERGDFLVLEIIDQCVRREPGGELGKLYSRLRAESELSSDLIGFIRERTGEDLMKPMVSAAAHRTEPVTRPWWARVGRRERLQLSRLWVRLCLSGLPAPFREQHVSMASVGERHHWLWDFHQLKEVLVAAGFVDVQRRGPKASGIEDFPFFPLDLDEEGRPRMGAESMYVEARRPGCPGGVQS